MHFLSCARECGVFVCSRTVNDTLGSFENNNNANAQTTQNRAHTKKNKYSLLSLRAKKTGCISFRVRANVASLCVHVR